LIKDQEQVEDTRVLLVALHQKEENDDMFQVKALPWDVDYEYKPMDFHTDSETPKEGFSNMNDIFGLIFISTKGTKNNHQNCFKKFKKKTDEKELEEYQSIRINLFLNFNIIGQLTPTYKIQ
jgi:hypothetical protein